MISGRVGVANHMSFIEHVEIYHPYVGTIAARVDVARRARRIGQSFPDLENPRLDQPQPAADECEDAAGSNSIHWNGYYMRTKGLWCLTAGCREMA